MGCFAECIRKISINDNIPSMLLYKVRKNQSITGHVFLYIPICLLLLPCRSAFHCFVQKVIYVIQFKKVQTQIL